MLWVVCRWRRVLLSRGRPEIRTAEGTALLWAGGLGAQWLVAAFLAATMFGFWFPPRHLLAALALAVPLAAWGLRHAPRVGACLSAISVAASLWLYLDVRLAGGGLVTPRPESPFGPLTAAFPSFDDSPWPYVLAGTLAAGLAGLAAFEARRWRQSR